MESGSFIDPQLKNLQSDILYSVKLKGEGKLLLKHGRSSDFWERFPEWMDALQRLHQSPSDGLRAVETLLR